MKALVPAFRYLSPAGPRARLSIFIFHRVLAEPDPLFPEIPDARRFQRMLRWMGGWFNVLSLDDAVKRLCSRSLPERAAVITFDDGYADNLDIAAPILKSHGMCATFFIATGFLDGGRMFNDTIIEAIRGCRRDVIDLSGVGLARFPLGRLRERRAAIERCITAVKYHPPKERTAAVAEIAASSGAALPQNLMLTSESVSALHRSGMQIGAHTVSHPILARVPDDAARSEIAESRECLEAIVGAPVTSFAYPNGKPGDDYAPKHVNMVRELGFAVGVSTKAGAALAGDDVLELPRFTPWQTQSLRFGTRLLANLAAARGTHAHQRTADSC